MKRLFCATFNSGKATKVTVESAFVRALPGFSIVGLPSQAIQESKDRIKSALSSIGFTFPAQKITINLSPSDVKKQGSHFDLSMAILIALQKEKCSMKNFFVFGELGLDGEVKQTPQIFPIVLSLASKQETSIQIIAPVCQKEILSAIPNINVYGVKNLSHAIDIFKDEQKQKEALHIKTKDILQNACTINENRYFPIQEISLDFSDVKGQTRAKRAALIGAVGMHNILFEGSPGCGKSMIAKRMPFILPPMSLKELLSINAIHNSTNVEFSYMRPFRSPHHTSSKPSIFGGGSSQAKEGEVALANHGILFFDEFPHFSKQVLESLREPLEDKKVLISRVNTKVEYETDFMFIAAQNPCPCGYLLSEHHACRCSELEIKRYKSKLSAPLLDRIDIYVAMDENRGDDGSDNSTSMREKVYQAFVFQKQRGQTQFNANLNQKERKKYCFLDTVCKDILEKAIARYGLSERGVHKCICLSRSIADIEQSDQIQKQHLLEALSFRKK